MNISIDSKWKEIHADRDWGQYPTEYVIRFIARNYYGVSDWSSIKILDFGCGGGSHTWYLSREGFDTYSFDGAPSAIHKVQLRMEREKLKAHLSVCDAISLNYKSDFLMQLLTIFVSQ